MTKFHMQSKKRFKVALSFPGEYRSFVQAVAEFLGQKLSQEQIFYDKWYEAELARPNLDTYLQKIYHDEAELIAVFFCMDYQKKEWCGLEWRAIRDLIKQKQDEAIMLISLDNTIIPGLYSIDGYISAVNKTPEETANLTLERLNPKFYLAKIERSTENNQVMQQAEPEHIQSNKKFQIKETAIEKNRLQESVVPQRKRNKEASSVRKQLRKGEELDEIIRIVDRAYARKTGRSLGDIQRTIVQGAWCKWSYEDIANNSRHNRITLEKSGPRLWEILSESFGERLNKTNFRTVMSRYLAKNGISFTVEDDEKNSNKRTSIQICEYISTLSGHTGWINSVIVSSNRQIISGSQDNIVKVWDLNTGKYLGDLGNHRGLRDFWRKILSKKHSASVYSVDISSDSKVLASASEDRTVIVWDLATYENLYSPLRHQGAVYCVAISPDKQFIASGCSDHTINIWDLKTGEQVKRRSERGAVKALAFSPDGQTLVSASQDKVVKIWNVQDWSSQNLALEYESAPDSLAISENGKILTISDKNRKIKVIDLHKREKLYSLSGQIAALSPDNEILATASDQEIRLWKQEAGELICSVKAGNMISSLAFSNDGLYLVSGQGNEIKTWRIRKDKLPSQVEGRI